MKKILLCLCVSVTLNASAQTENNSIDNKEKIDKQIAQAVTSPLSDLNIGNEDIPNILKLAKEKPYILPEDKSCISLLSEIETLNSILGDDIDEQQKEKESGLIKKGKDLASNTAVSTIRRTVQDVIPYRNWIRKLSGAEKHEKEFNTCVEAGKVRRAFLKGYVLAAGCNHEPEKKEEVESYTLPY